MKLGAKGIRTIDDIDDIDDILILGSSYAICLKNTLEALHLLIDAGFVIPSTNFPFLGFQWNTVQASLAIPQTKVDAFRSQAKILSNLTAPTCRLVLVLTGIIAAFCQAVPLLCLKGRWLQISLNSVYSSELDLQKTVILSFQARRDLKWIISLSPHQCFAPLWFLSPEVGDLEVQTDASKLGYGIWFEGFLHQGLWHSTAARLHINGLATTALWNFLACILPKSSKQQHHGLHQEGGTCSSQVLVEAEKVLVKAHQMSVLILPIFIPTGENILADAASLFQEIPD
jgi:hypothetical protein